MLLLSHQLLMCPHPDTFLGAAVLLLLLSDCLPILVVIRPTPVFFITSYSKYLPCLCLLSACFPRPWLDSSHQPVPLALPPTRNLAPQPAPSPPPWIPSGKRLGQTNHFGLYITLEISLTFFPSSHRVPRPHGFSSRPPTNSTY